MIYVDMSFTGKHRRGGPASRADTTDSSDSDISVVEVVAPPKRGRGMCRVGGRHGQAMHTTATAATRMHCW